MKNGNECFVTGMKKGATIVTLAIGIGSSGMTGLAAQGLAILVAAGEAGDHSAKQVLLQH